MAFMQNFDVIHVYGKGPTLKAELPTSKDDGKILHLCIGQAANAVPHPTIIATNHCEEWAVVERKKIDQCNWIITPRHPLIEGTQQTIMEWNDINLIKSKKNVACYKLPEPGESSVVSCLRHVLKNGPFISKIRFSGVASRNGYYKGFGGRGAYNARDRVRSLKAEINGLMETYKISAEYY